MHGEVALSGGGKLYFESEGSGHPVVLIHAGIVDRRMWDRQFRELATRFHAIRYDVRGFGRSTRAAAPYSDAQDLALILRQLDIERPMLVGVSNGGRIALDYAVEHPEGVEALVAVCSGLAGYDPREDREAVAAFEELGRREKIIADLYRLGKLDDALEALLGLWAPRVPTDRRAFVRSMMLENKEMAFQDEELSVPLAPLTATRLGDIRAPTLVISAEHDAPGLEFISDYIFQHVPGAERSEIAGADHLPNLSQPDAFERVLLPFLE